MNRLGVGIYLVPGKAATLLLLLVGVRSFAVADGHSIAGHSIAGHSIAGHSPAGHFPAEDWLEASAEEVNLDQSKIDRLFRSDLCRRRNSGRRLF